MTQTKKVEIKQFKIERGIERDGVRFERGQVVTEEKLREVFPADVLRFWQLRGVIVEVNDEPAG